MPYVRMCEIDRIPSQPFPEQLLVIACALTVRVVRLKIFSRILLKFGRVSIFSLLLLFLILLLHLLYLHFIYSPFNMTMATGRVKRGIGCPMCKTSEMSTKRKKNRRLKSKSRDEKRIK